MAALGRIPMPGSPPPRPRVSVPVSEVASAPSPPVPRRAWADVPPGRGIWAAMLTPAAKSVPPNGREDVRDEVPDDVDASSAEESAPEPTAAAEATPRSKVLTPPPAPGARTGRRPTAKQPR